MKCLLMTLLLSFSINCYSMTRAKITMPATKKIHGRLLFLNGMGIRKATTLGIKVYVAGLYLEEKNESPESIVEDTKSIKHLIMHFVRDIDKEKIIEGWRTGFKHTSKNKLDNKIDIFLRHMTAIKSGQEIKLNFLPKKVEIMIDNTVIKPITGADFNKALLMIWFKGLSDKTLSNDLLGIH